MRSDFVCSNILFYGQYAAKKIDLIEKHLKDTTSLETTYVTHVAITKNCIM